VAKVTDFWAMDEAAQAAFDEWVARLAELGCGPLGGVDRVVVGAAALSEASLGAARRAVVAAEGLLGASRRPVIRTSGQFEREARQELRASRQDERAALRAFQQAVSWLEECLGQRAGSVRDVEATRALPEGEPVRRSSAWGRAEQEVRGRILNVLGERGATTKEALFLAAGGGKTAFLRALNALLEDKAVVRSGVGRRRDPYRYELSGGGEE
jgi:hypothetical protein